MFNIICNEIAAILLFFYAIHRFSKIIARCNIHYLKRFFSKITNNSIKSLSVGAGAACLMQSNKAVSSIALTLVNASIINSIKTLPILFGTLIGSSSTAFLVSIKIDCMEEFLIIIGTLIKKIKKYKNIGHIIFYLGLLLFALELMSQSTSSLRDEEWFKSLFLFSDNVLVLFIFGCLLSFMLQSGALVTSIVTILVNCNVLPLYNSVAIGIGVAVGSTLSLFIVSYSMNREAKKCCYTHLIFIFIFGLLSLTFTDTFTSIGSAFKGGISFAISNVMLRITISLSGYICFIILFKNHKIILKILDNIKNKSLKHNENYETHI